MVHRLKKVKVPEKSKNRQSHQLSKPRKKESRLKMELQELRVKSSQ